MRDPSPNPVSPTSSTRPAARRRPIWSSRRSASSTSARARWRRADIAVCGDRIVGTYETYSGATEIDGRGLFAVPGFIDSHVHFESSLVPPLEFDRCVVPHGITTAICDPHEIANVLGIPGLRYFLECAARTVMDLRVQLSSCVPATHLETSGARLDAEDLLPFSTIRR